MLWRLGQLPSCLHMGWAEGEEQEYWASCNIQARQVQGLVPVNDKHTSCLSASLPSVTRDSPSRGWVYVCVGV